MPGKILLTPGDPRNALSPEAMSREYYALARGRSIRETAFASLWARCCETSEWDGAALQQWSEAKMEAAFVYLSVLTEEFMRIGMNGISLEETMQSELQAAGYSWELSDIEQRAVWSRLQTIMLPGELGRPRRAIGNSDGALAKKTGRPGEQRLDGEKLKTVRGKKSQVAF